MAVSFPRLRIRRHRPRAHAVDRGMARVARSLASQCAPRARHVRGGRRRVRRLRLHRRARRVLVGPRCRAARAAGRHPDGMAPAGVAFVSYNAHAGEPHSRRAARHDADAHAGVFRTRPRRVEQARALLSLLGWRPGTRATCIGRCSSPKSAAPSRRRTTSSTTTTSPTSASRSSSRTLWPAPRRTRARVRGRSQLPPDEHRRHAAGNAASRWPNSAQRDLARRNSTWTS